jgi:phosphoglycolate phosphatase
VIRPTDLRVDAVCWDWNGTLLDDVDIARATMNLVLAERLLPGLPDHVAYRRVFGFPVRDFYTRVGIAEAEFRAAAMRFLQLFADGIAKAALQPGARETLAMIERLGVEQVLISATVEDALQQQMSRHVLDDYFVQILGVTDAHVASKADVVARWLESSGHDPRRVLMVGDTNHDEEIAEDLGVNFVRFAHGHQQPPDHDRHPVVQDLRDVIQHITGRPNPG